MKANFGLFPPPPNQLAKSDRYRWYSERALTAMRRFARANGLRYDQALAEGNLAEAVGERLTAVSP